MPLFYKGRIIAEDSPENLQARLVGAERSILRVKGDADELVSQVTKIKGVQDVKVRSDGALEFQFRLDVGAVGFDRLDGPMQAGGRRRAPSTFSAPFPLSDFSWCTSPWWCCRGPGTTCAQ